MSKDTNKYIRDVNIRVLNILFKPMLGSKDIGIYWKSPKTLLLM
jgi:hypothetical protein